jgi:hypothetical protein
MMILLSAIGGLSAASLRASRHVETHLDDIEAARRILEELPSRRNLGDYPLSGEAAGYRWRVEAGKSNASVVEPNRQNGWIPETVVLTLQGPRGANLRFDMVRLIRTSGQ